MNSSIVIPAGFKRESSGALGWIPAKKHAGMTKWEVPHFVHLIL
jgi:hypothetical protein